MKTPETTPEQLKEIMEKHLQDEGKPAEFIEGYIEAQIFSGWLRPRCPPWIRNSAAMHYLTQPRKPQKGPTTKHETP